MAKVRMCSGELSGALFLPQWVLGWWKRNGTHLQRTVGSGEPQHARIADVVRSNKLGIVNQTLGEKGKATPDGVNHGERPTMFLTRWPPARSLPRF